LLRLNSGPKFAPKTGQSRKYINEVAIQIFLASRKTGISFYCKALPWLQSPLQPQDLFFSCQTGCFNNKPDERKKKTNLEYKIDIHCSY
jgi:hypothetical protein